MRVHAEHIARAKIELKRKYIFLSENIFNF